MGVFLQFYKKSIYIMTTPFWSNEPTILFNTDNILQVWPQPAMSFEAKLNAISRF
ncbi:MAG: hypothetical protein ACFFKA_17410, partial [Candidatus Thorarchaeota archaeon]